MKAIATIQADLEVTPLGTKSRLSEELCGVPILRRTVQRVLGAKSLAGVYVLCPAEQQQRCRAILSGTRAVVQPYETEPPPWDKLVRSARKWSLDGWRGGVGGTTYFDEFTDCRLIAGLLDKVETEIVLSAPPAAPLIDTSLIDRMVEHYQEFKETSRLTFTQAPPGLAGIVLEASLAGDLAKNGTPIGWILSYKPDQPEKDLIFQPSCCDIPAELRHAVGRLLCDTRRSTDRVADLIGEQDNPDLAGVGRWLTRRETTGVEALPREVEIELTTDDPYPEALLRPRGSRVTSRGPIDPAIVRQVVTETARYDDTLIVLGGFGDPLRHPRFGEILETLSSAASTAGNLYGLAVCTSAADLTDEHIQALVACGVDILEVRFDAWTPELYARLQTPGHPHGANLDDVRARLDRLNAERQKHQSVTPIVLPSMTKSRENVDELDDFHDGWLRRVGAVAIHGAGHYARQCEDRSVINMAPKPRVGCRRLRSRCLVLADGRVAICDQDFNGCHTVGLIGEQSLEEIWLGDKITRIREAHRQGRFDPTPLCAVCDEWHRP